MWNRKKKKSEEFEEDEEEDEEDEDEPEEEEEEDEEEEPVRKPKKRGRKPKRVEPEDDRILRPVYTPQSYGFQNLDDPKETILADSMEAAMFQMICKLANDIEEIKKELVQ